jgi:hypothetical protein
MGGNYISGNTSHSFYFFFSLLTQVEGFYHLESMTSSSNHGSSSTRNSFSTFGSNSFGFSSSSDDGMQEMFVDMDKQKQCAFATAVIVANSFDMFNANELEEGVGHFVDSSVGVWWCLLLCEQHQGYSKL